MEDMKDIEKLKKELKICQKQSHEYLLGWKRERADFLNFKKDETERMKRYIDIAKEEIILDFIFILDNMHLAEKELPKGIPWTKGFLGIKAQMEDFLKRQGVEEIDCLNKEFDPCFHEAIEQAEEPKDGKIIEVIQKGYIFKNKVIRPSKVKVK